MRQKSCKKRCNFWGLVLVENIKLDNCNIINLYSNKDFLFKECKQLGSITMSTIIIIPARLASTRLPNKPLADIAGKPMILHVYEQAMNANIGEVLVACDHEDIAKAIESAGGKSVLTDPALPSGSDRVWAAYKNLGLDFETIVNLQGDLPVFNNQILLKACKSLKYFDIGTLAVHDTNTDDPNIVKIAAANTQDPEVLRALYFSRSVIPHGAKTIMHHIGIYAYKREALEKFVSLKPSPLEIQERLEQLRALEAGFSMGVVLTDSIPISVDTPEDLEIVRSSQSVVDNVNSGLL